MKRKRTQLVCLVGNFSIKDTDRPERIFVKKVDEVFQNFYDTTPELTTGRKHV